MIGSLLQAVLDQPDDDAIRLVYADAIEDRNYAEYIRLDITADPHDLEAWNKNCERRRELLTPVTAKNWFPGFWNDLPSVMVRSSGKIEYYNAVTDELCWVTVNNGFVEELFCTWNDWASHHSSVLARHPIQIVNLATWPVLSGPWKNVESLLKHYWPRIRFKQMTEHDRYAKHVIADFTATHYKPGDKVKFLGPKDERLEGVVIGGYQVDASFGTTWVILNDGQIVEIDGEEISAVPEDVSLVAPDYCSKYLSDPDAVLVKLYELEWLSVADVRREYFMSDKRRSYIYGKGRGKREYHSAPFSHGVDAIMNQLNGDFKTDYNVCFLNRYDSPQDHLGWHADDSPTMDRSHPIAVISVGAEREIWWRKNGQTGVVPWENRQRLRHGSLFVMPRWFQDHFQHRIPKADRDCGTRISMTFRRYV